MTDVVDPAVVPTKREDHKYYVRLVSKLVAAIVIVGGTVALVAVTRTNNSQQALIDRNNRAALCRSQVTAATDGVVNIAFVKLLEDPSTEGQIAILDLIVSSQNEQPVDYEAIAQVAERMRTAQADRRAYTQKVVEAVARREQAVQAC